MGKNSPTGKELASSVQTDALTAVSNGTPILMIGTFNAVLSGTFVGTAQLQRSFDGGSTFVPCDIDSSGTVANYTAPVSVVVQEPEPGVFYRWACTAFTSGTINARISGGARLT